jgi:hypothetical protein
MEYWNNVCYSSHMPSRRCVELSVYCSWDCTVSLQTSLSRCRSVSIMLFSTGTILHMAYACMKFAAYLTNLHKNEFQLYFKAYCMVYQPFTNKQSSFFGIHAQLKLIVKVCYGLQGWVRIVQFIVCKSNSSQWTLLHCLCTLIVSPRENISLVKQGHFGSINLSEWGHFHISTLLWWLKHLPEFYIVFLSLNTLKQLSTMSWIIWQRLLVTISDLLILGKKRYVTCVTLTLANTKFLASFFYQKLEYVLQFRRNK